jgi:hypothetical protein
MSMKAWKGKPLCDQVEMTLHKIRRLKVSNIKFGTEVREMSGGTDVEGISGED